MIKNPVHLFNCQLCLITVYTVIYLYLWLVEGLHIFYPMLLPYFSEYKSLWSICRTSLLERPLAGVCVKITNMEIYSGTAVADTDTQV